MGIVAYDNLTGRVHKAEDVELADKLVQERKNKGHWEVKTELVDAWMRRTPEEFKAFKVHLQYTREDLKDPEFAKTSDQIQERRLVAIIPMSLMAMIRSMYSPRELIMDRKFHQEFARRFKFFQVPDKI